MPTVTFDEKKFLEGLQAWLQVGDLLPLIEQFRVAPATEKVPLMLKIIDKVMEQAAHLLGDIAVLAENEDALNAVVGFLDDCIRLPFYLEWFDGPALKMIVKAVVDIIVKYTKK